MSRLRSCAFVLLVAFLCEGCAGWLHLRSSPLEFVYPAGSPAMPPTDVKVNLPVRVGLAFIPETEANVQADFMSRAPTMTESQKQALLARVAKAFEGRREIGRIEVVPSAYLRPGGSFQNLDLLAIALGIDLVVLVGIDQVQFNETTRGALTY